MTTRIWSLLALPVLAVGLAGCVSDSTADNVPPARDESAFLAAVKQYETPQIDRDELIRQGDAVCESLTDSADADGLYQALVNNADEGSGPFFGETRLRVMSAAVKYLCPEWAEVDHTSWGSATALRS